MEYDEEYDDEIYNKLFLYFKIFKIIILSIIIFIIFKLRDVDKKGKDLSKINIYYNSGNKTLAAFRLSNIN